MIQWKKKLFMHSAMARMNEEEKATDIELHHRALHLKMNEKKIQFQLKFDTKIGNQLFL